MAACTLVHDQSDERRGDAALVLKARNGDAAAQAELFLKFHEKTLGWMHRWMPHKQWKQEFADHAIGVVFACLDKFDPERGAFGSWVYMVVRSAVLKHIHDLHVDRADFPYDEMLEDALPAVFGPEDEFPLSRLHEEVARLEHEQRAAVEGFFFCGYSDVELAAMLGIPKRRVCYRRKQGLAELRRRLSDAA